MSQQRDENGRFLPRESNNNEEPSFIRWLLVSFLIAGFVFFGIATAFAASRADLEKSFNANNQKAFHHDQLAKQYREAARSDRCDIVSDKLYMGEELRDPSKARIECADTIPEDFWLGTPK